MKLTFLLSVLLCTAGAIASAPAEACSLVAGTVPSTSLEMAAEAEIIMLARVEDGPTEYDPGATVRVRPLHVYKGRASGSTMEIHGIISTGPRRMLSDPKELIVAHPEAGSGSCNRYSLAKGATTIFYLKRWNGGWSGAGGAFSRWAEDVPSRSAPWARTTRIYSRIAQMPKSRWEAALRAAVRVLVATGRPDDRLIANALQIQLGALQDRRRR
jgi:hypothetical protein